MQDFALGPRNAFYGTEALEVRGARIRDSDHVGLGKAAQVGDLARVVRAHFEHGIAMRRLDAGHHQRHADVVVEIARGRERRRDFRQAGCGEFLQGGLAVAAGDADHDGRLLPPPAPRQFAQGEARVGDRDLRNRLVRASCDERTGGAAARRFGEVVAAIEVRPLERHEQLAARERAGVGADAVEGAVGSVQDATGICRRGRQLCHHSRDSRAPSARAAWAKSENARRWPPISW